MQASAGDIAFYAFAAYAFALAVWMTSAQNAYFRAYSRLTGEFAPTPQDLLFLSLRPWQLLTKAPLTAIMRATNTRQTDPGLEALRQHFLLRRKLAFGAFFVGAFLLGAIEVR